MAVEIELTLVDSNPTTMNAPCPPTHGINYKLAMYDLQALPPACRIMNEYERDHTTTVYDLQAASSRTGCVPATHPLACTNPNDTLQTAPSMGSCTNMYSARAYNRLSPRRIDVLRFAISAVL